MSRVPSIGDKCKLVEGLMYEDTGIYPQYLEELYSKDYLVIEKVSYNDGEDEIDILINGWCFSLSQIVLLDDEHQNKGKKFKHFKGGLYLLLDIAQHTESDEELVIYKALYGDYKVYARPKDMFFSKVDKVKHPNETQEYRFELVEG